MLLKQQVSVVYKKEECAHFVHRIIVFYLTIEFIINGNNQKLMIIKELFEEPVGDYCIARYTIKYLFIILFLGYYEVFYVCL